MHDGTIAQADTWLRSASGATPRWAAAHRSRLVVTWDEDDRSQDNRIPTLIDGAGIRPGRYDETAGPYRLLRTVTDALGAAPVGGSASVTGFTDIWRR